MHGLATDLLDHRSQLIVREQLLFNEDGSVDQRSSAVRSGIVLLTSVGDVDLRSSAFNDKSLLQKPTTDNPRAVRTNTIPRADSTREKKGSKEDGTHGAHILSFKLIKAIYKSKPGPKYSEDEAERIAIMLNQSGNVRLKTEVGNLVGDEALDKEITRKNGSGVALTKAATKRAQRQVHVLKSREFPRGLKSAGTKFYQNSIGWDGKPILETEIASQTAGVPRVKVRTYVSTNIPVDKKASVPTPKAVEFCPKDDRSGSSASSSQGYGRSEAARAQPRDSKGRSASLPPSSDTRSPPASPKGYDRSRASRAQPRDDRGRFVKVEPSPSISKPSASSSCSHLSYSSPSSSTYSGTTYSTSSSSSTGGGTFYKGGQFIPGGGRAPAGGITK